LTPPYLLNPDGSAARRPVIQGVSPDTIVYPPPANADFQRIAVTMTPGAHLFSLVRLSAGTHAVNNDVRRIPLQIVSRDGTKWTLGVPSDRNIAIPGSYWLFAINKDGVPSIGATVVIEGLDQGPYILTEPTASPVGATCWSECARETIPLWLCNKDWGCEGCDEPQEDLCKKFCNRCEGRENNQFAGLDCHCSDDVSPPTPPDICSEGCGADNFKTGFCFRTTGCEGCPVADTCNKLCRRCEGREQIFGGLDCQCSGSMPPPPPPPIPMGACWTACESEEEKEWICPRTKGCQGCPRQKTCDKLCRRCEGLAENAYGGLNCDCDSAPPPQEDCFVACGAESGGAWICGFNMYGCTTCEDVDDVCDKLCDRCGLAVGQHIVAGLTCNCR